MAGVTEFNFITNFTESDKYREEIHKLIPGGGHTYSKGDDQFPVRSPAAIVKGEGAHVWDLDGNKYVDCSMGLSSVSLGHAYKPVVDAVKEQLDLGSNFQRPASIERDVAKLFLDLVPQHDRIKFSKNGSTCTTAAMKLARAYTGRKYVVRPHNHPFYSYDDWFIGTTPCDNGIPQEIKDLTLTFDSMKPDTLRDLVKKYPNQIAGLITEPDAIADNEYTKEYVAECMQEIIVICKEAGIVCIIDEMVSGFRSGFPGAISVYGHQADICCWGKSIGTGFSFCAMTGKAEIFDLGGIKKVYRKDGTEHPRVFLTSTTHGGETHALAAVKAVIKEYKEKNVIKHLHSNVKLCHEGWIKAVKEAGLEKHIEIRGQTWFTLAIFKDKEGNASSPYRTLFLQEMIKRGVLFQGVFLGCFSHTPEDVQYIVAAFKDCLSVYEDALAKGAEHYLVGPAAQAVFRKWN